MVRQTVFTLTVFACSGQPAPAVPLPPPSAPPREVYITADAAVPVVVGAACDARAPCGPGLTCEPWPGGYCAASCSGTCGNGVCVEQPDRALCLASCTTDADCRASEGYACDPTWHACALANTTAIVPATCPAPIGFGRDPAFAPPTRIGELDGRDPAMIVTDKGAVVVAYPATHAGAPMLHLARIEPNGTVRDAVWYPAGESPRLARSGTQLFASWVVHQPSGSQILFAKRSTDELAVVAPAPLDVSAGDCKGTRCDRPIIATGADPQKPGASIVYAGYIAGDGVRIRASRDGGATFAAAKTALPGIRGALAIDAKGVIYAVALRGNPRADVSADSRIDLAISYDGARTFTRPQTISRYAEKLPQFGAGPQVEVDSNRKILYVAYARGGRDGKWDIVLGAYKQTAYKPAWSYARIGDDPACAIHMAPAIAVDPVSGALHVSWYDSRGNRVAHGVCTEGLGQCRQLGRINDVPFTGLSLSRGSPRGVGDSQALVVDWQRRALHAVWTQPTAEGPRIFHAKAPLR